MLTKAYNGTEFMLYPNELIIVNRKHHAGERKAERNFCVFGRIKESKRNYEE